MQQSPVRKYILPEPPRAVLSSHLIKLLLAVAIKDTQIKVARRVVDAPVARVRVEYAMNDQIRQGEKQAADACRVGRERVFRPRKEQIEHAAGIGEGRRRNGVGGRHGASVGSASHTKGRIEEVIIGSMGRAVRIIYGFPGA